MSNPPVYLVGFHREGLENFSEETREIALLIIDLDLVPRNYWAADFYQILENEEIVRNRIECDLRLLSKRNHSRSYDVFASSNHNVQASIEFE